MGRLDHISCISTLFPRTSLQGPCVGSASFLSLLLAPGRLSSSLTVSFRRVDTRERFTVLDPRTEEPKTWRSWIEYNVQYAECPSIFEEDSSRTGFGNVLISKLATYSRSYILNHSLARSLAQEDKKHIRSNKVKSILPPVQMARNDHRAHLP